MDASNALRNAVLKLEQTVKTFKLGAVSARRQTIEEKITEAVNALTVSEAKNLNIKARIEEARQSLDEEPVEPDLALSLDEYEIESGKLKLKKSLWQHCTEASTLHAIRMGKIPVDEETLRFVEEHLLEVAQLQMQLNEVMKEEEEVSKKIMEKKEELKIALHSYQEKMEEAKKKKQDLASQEDEQSLRQKRQIELKLEKLNVMRYFMGRLLAISRVDYLKEPKWGNLLLEIQNPITMEDLIQGKI